MSRKRSRQIAFRVTDEEYDCIMNMVEESGMSQQDFLIFAITNTVIINMNDIKELIPDLKRVGNNLNQIAKKSNQGKIPCEEDIIFCVKELDELWQLLKQYIAERQSVTQLITSQKKKRQKTT